MLEIEALTKKYGEKYANEGISLAVSAGEVFGLLGPNGAGKTTLVRQVIGLTRPDSGRVRINGVDVVADPRTARRACSWQPQAQVPIAALSPAQAIQLVGRARGAVRSAARARSLELLEMLDITEWAEKPGAMLSGGVARLVACAMAAVVPGQVVIFDEPTNDVDPLRRRLLWKLVAQLARDGAAVLLVTHNVLEAERAVDRLAVLDCGRVVASGTPASLKGTTGDFRLELLLEPGAGLSERPSFMVGEVSEVGRHLLAEVASDRIEEAVRWACLERNAGRVEEFTVGPTTLEDVYVRLIAGGSVPETTAWKAA